MNTKVRGWTFTHWWVRPVVWFWFRIYHKSVTISEVEPVNWNKPIIFAPTHQNAFSDALCLILPAQYTNNRFIYPLVRADAFGKNTLTDWILTIFHMLPVYRPRDNVDLKTENESVFTACHNILSQNCNLLVHPEGNCIPLKQVRNFKKGLARIAFGAENINSFDLGVQVIPVGINYRNITESRSGIHIRYGKPIYISDYIESYRQNNALAIKQLTDDIRTGMKAVSIDIESVHNYNLAEEIINLSTKASSRLNKYTLQELRFHQDIVGKFKKLNLENPEIIKNLKDKISELKELMQQVDLEIEHLSNKNTSSVKRFLERTLFAILSPVILYGLLNNSVPWLLMKKIPAGIKELQFKSSARLLAGLLLFPFFYLFQGYLFLFFTGSIGWSILYLLSIPLTGVITLNLLERYKILKQTAIVHRARKTNNSVLKKIYSLRDEILSKLQIHSDIKSFPDPAKPEEL